MVLNEYIIGEKSMKQIILATKNKNKLVEVKAVFTKTGETKNDESKTDSSTEEAKTIN